MGTLIDNEHDDTVLREKFIRFLDSNPELKKRYAQIIGHQDVCAWKNRGEYLPLLITSLSDESNNASKNNFFGENEIQTMLWNLKKFCKK